MGINLTKKSNLNEKYYYKKIHQRNLKIYSNMDFFLKKNNIY
jgi:hypothetical protein